MQKHNFDEILDFLCSGIPMKSARESVRDELFDHLMCKYETNIACGLDEENAAESAIKDLGDVSALKFKLSSVHGYAPKPTLKKAMNLLIAGFVLISFHISLFNGMADITKFIGSIMFLVAVFCLAKANNKLNKAFIVRSALFVLDAAAGALMPDWFDGFNINAPLGIITGILNITFWICFLGGLYELVRPYESIKPLKKRINFSLFVNVIISGVQIILFCAYFVDNDYWIDDPEVAWLLIPFAVASIIANLFVFVGVSKLLWNSDHEYKIETSSSKKIIIAVVAVLLAVVPRIAVDIYCSTQKADVSVYNVDDSDISEAEYNRICNNLLSYGIPEEIVYMLPESEIENYSDCIHKSEFSEFAQQFMDDNDNPYVQKHHDTSIENGACAIGFEDYHIRVLSWVKYIECPGEYTNGIFWNNEYIKMYPVNLDDEYNGDFLLILSEENGEVIKNEPLNIYVDENGLTDRMTGARFQVKEGLTVIHAESFWVESIYQQWANYGLTTVNRRNPFSFLNRSPLRFYESAQHNSFEYNNIFSLFEVSWAIPGVDYEEQEEISNAE